MVVLGLLALGGLDLALQTALAMPTVRRVILVTVEDEREEAMEEGLDGLLVLQVVVDLLVAHAHRFRIDDGSDPTKLVGTGQGGFYPIIPTFAELEAFQRVEAPEAADEHREDATCRRSDGD